MAAAGSNLRRVWPDQGVTRIPYFVYEDAELYEAEQELVFRGPAWNYLCLEIDIPAAGDYITNQIGDTPVIVVRGADGGVRALVNRCAHKGAMICYAPSGNVAALTCPYHNWVYDFDGKLQSVAFRHGVGGQGGMPADFALTDHSLVPLRVATIRGLVFGSFSPAAAPLEEFLGARLVAHVERTLNRPYRILGRCSQTMHCNWKLYAENSRDTYHPSLLHSFATMFKLNRLSAEGGIEMDDAGWHHLVFARRHTDQASADYDAAALRANDVGCALADPRLIEDWVEWDDGITNSIMTLFPCLNLQQSLNTVAIRQMVPRGPLESELFWTFLGFADDDEQKTQIRLRQSNLFGPAGFISLEDGAIGEFVQKAVRGEREQMAVVEMGGRDVGPSPKTRTTETSVRGFWRTYRRFMSI
jgi:anthranilate 1,2-dioxygenase large subunit/terephthalate 1,2-dioxygenase oxygenase component alpha subunit